jgi:hypothetical protein
MRRIYESYSGFKYGSERAVALLSTGRRGELSERKIGPLDPASLIGDRAEFARANRDFSRRNAARVHAC